MGDQMPPARPLDNPDLAAKLRDDLQNKHRQAEAQRSLYILERYAWQQYPVKYRRWHKIVARAKSEMIRDTVLDNYTGRWEWQPDHSVVLLLDPATGSPIAEHSLAGSMDFPWLPADATHVWFAGNPRVSGMFTAVGDGSRAVFGRSRALWGVAKPFESLPDRDFPTTNGPYVERLEKSEGSWLADSPQPPAGPKPSLFSRLTGRS